MHYPRMRQAAVRARSVREPLWPPASARFALWRAGVALLAHQDFADADCLKWPFADDGKGYGVIKVDGRQQYAHRIMCTLVNGEPPTELHETAHSCGNGHLGCVHPGHVRWATRAENHAD